MEMAHLEHLFVRGVRFDTEVQYLARGAAGLVYEGLPIRKAASAQTCALASVIQCLAIQGQLSRQQIRQTKRRAREALRGVDDDSILRCINASGAPVVARLHSLGSSRVGQFGAAALEALRLGHVCLVHFESVKANRWATVIGVEWDRATNEARALLLLDMSASEPWACAHNVRIELQVAAGRSVRASSGFMLNCRDLMGGACAVRLGSLIVLRRSVPAGP